MTTGSGHWIDATTRLAVYLRDHFHCVYCDKDLSLLPSNRLSLDHITPRKDEGEHEPKNLATACINCNSSKKAKPLAEFVACPDRLARILDAVTRPINIELARAIIAGHVDRTVTIVELRTQDTEEDSQS